MRTAAQAYICSFICFICAILCTVFLALTVIERDIPLFTLPFIMTSLPIVIMYMGAGFLLVCGIEHSKIDRRYRRK